MRSKDMKLGEEDFVLKTNIKKENPWLYFLDKDGDISCGKMGALISVNPARYAKPEKVKRLGIKREKGFLYSINDDGDIIRQLIL